jgi:hypothetical protein
VHFHQHLDAQLAGARRELVDEGKVCGVMKQLVPGFLMA